MAADRRPALARLPRRAGRGARRCAAGRGGRGRCARRRCGWAKASEWERAEWPQPRCSGYSASAYWPSWISSEASRASSKPEIQLLVERVEVGAQRRLVVGDVGERAVAVVDPVAERRAAVGDRGGADPRRADLPLGLRAVAEGDVAGQLADLDRRERRRDVAGDAVAQRGLGRGRPPDDDLGLGAEGRGEEDEALDVVEVQVGEEDVEAGRLVGQGEAEVADAGAGVEREQRAVGEGDADAGGVAAVADRLRAGEGIEPRVPQSLAFISGPPRSVEPLRPEDGDRALRAVRGEDREGRGLDRVAGAVGRADLEVGVGGAAVADGDDQRQLVVGDRLAARRRRGRRASPTPRRRPCPAPRSVCRAAPRRPRCRRRGRRPRRPGRPGSRAPTSGCERGSARVASASQMTL